MRTLRLNLPESLETFVRWQASFEGHADERGYVQALIERARRTWESRREQSNISEPRRLVRFLEWNAKREAQARARGLSRNTEKEWRAVVRWFDDNVRSAILSQALRYHVTAPAARGRSRAQGIGLTSPQQRRRRR